MGLEVDLVDLDALMLYEAKGNCGYCGVSLNELEGVILQSCFHIFCRECLASSIELQETVEIVCPQGCGGRLLEKEIKALSSREVFRKWEERGMKAAKASLGECAVECNWPGCNGWAEMDNIDSRRIFVCPFCGKQNCIKCKAVHDGVSCEEFDQLKAKAATTGESVMKLLEQQEGRDWGFSQVRNQLARSKQRQSLGTFLNKDVLRTETEIECTICFGNIAAGDGIILHECFHTFCNECIIDLVRHSDTPEVKCPYIDANFTCTCFLSPREIKSLAPPEVYESWLEKSVKLAEGAIVNSVHCKTLDCPGWVEVEDVENATGAFTCVVCEKTNCLQCKAIHEGVSCDDYKNRLVQSKNDKMSEDALNDMVAKGECMRCPKCKTLVQKLVGCDWLMCSCCRTELCWATKGPRWGPKGKGDTSGGCGCQYYLTGGKKCVPHCQNCH